MDPITAAVGAAAIIGGAALTAGATVVVGGATLVHAMRKDHKDRKLTREQHHYYQQQQALQQQALQQQTGAGLLLYYENHVNNFSGPFQNMFHGSDEQLVDVETISYQVALHNSTITYRQEQEQQRIKQVW